MSPIDRDRAREKRRYEKHQTKLEMREVEARRNKQVLGIVLAMLLVIGGLVGVSLALNKDSKPWRAASPPARLTDQPTPATTSSRRRRVCHPAEGPHRQANRHLARQEDRGRQDVHRDRHHELWRHHDGARRDQGSPDRGLVPRPGQERLLGRQPVSPPDHRQEASSSCSAATRQAPAAATPDTASASRTHRPTSPSPPARSRWRAPTTPRAMAASSSSSTSRPCCRTRRLFNFRQDHLRNGYRRQDRRSRSQPCRRQQQHRAGAAHQHPHGGCRREEGLTVTEQTPERPALRHLRARPWRRPTRNQRQRAIRSCGRRARAERPAAGPEPAPACEPARRPLQRATRRLSLRCPARPH